MKYRYMVLQDYEERKITVCIRTADCGYNRRKEGRFMNIHWENYKKYLDSNHLDYELTDCGMFEMKDALCNIQVSLNDTMDVKISYPYSVMKEKPDIGFDGSIGIISYTQTESGIIFERKAIPLEKIDVKDICFQVEKTIRQIEETANLFVLM